MSELLVSSGSRQVLVEAVEPAAQASTASAVAVTGSNIDMRSWKSLAYTIKNITNTITWSVWGANAADFSDEVSLYSADVLAAAADSYAVAQAPYAYYRTKIVDKVGGNHGTATVRGIAKY